MKIVSTWSECAGTIFVFGIDGMAHCCGDVAHGNGDSCGPVTLAGEVMLSDRCVPSADTLQIENASLCGDRNVTACAYYRGRQVSLMEDEFPLPCWSSYFSDE